MWAICQDSVDAAHSYNLPKCMKLTSGDTHEEQGMLLIGSTQDGHVLNTLLRAKFSKIIGGNPL